MQREEKRNFREMKINSALHTDYEHAHIQIHCLLVPLLLLCRLFCCFWCCEILMHNDIALILAVEHRPHQRQRIFFFLNWTRWHGASDASFVRTYNIPTALVVKYFHSLKSLIKAHTYCSRQKKRRYHNIFIGINFAYEYMKIYAKSIYFTLSASENERDGKK